MEYGDDWLDANFPLGDGVADTSAVVECPHCGHPNDLTLDPGGAAVQRYIEDCEACCRPIQLTVRWNASGRAEVDAAPEDDA